MHMWPLRHVLWVSYGENGKRKPYQRFFSSFQCLNTASIPLTSSCSRGRDVRSERGEGNVRMAVDSESGRAGEWLDFLRDSKAHREPRSIICGSVGAFVKPEPPEGMGVGGGGGEGEEAGGGDTAEAHTAIFPAVSASQVCERQSMCVCVCVCVGEGDPCPINDTLYCNQSIVGTRPALKGKHR